MCVCSVLRSYLHDDAMMENSIIIEAFIYSSIIYSQRRYTHTVHNSKVKDNAN